MKRTIAVILFFVGICHCVHAQVVSPKASVVQADKTYYLYNKSKNGFLTGGNKYGTQASISRDHAYKVVLKKRLDQNGEWDGETYFITDSVEYGDFRNSFRNVFIERDGNVFVDQDSGHTPGRDNLWVIRAKENDIATYSIRPSLLNATFKSPSLRLCAKNMSENLKPVVGIFEKGEDDCAEWSFVLPQDAENYLKQRIEERQHKKNEILQRLFSNFVSKEIPCEDTVYLYNLVLDRFLIGENQDKSQASLAKDAAYKVIVHKYFDQSNQWDGVTYSITDSVEAGDYSGSFRNLFIENNGIIRVNQEKETLQRDYLWEFVPSQNRKNTFNIRPSHKNKIFTPDNLPDIWLGSTDFHNPDYPIVSLVLGNVDSTATEWFFLTKKQRDIVNCAHQRQVLQELVFEVSDAFPKIDFSAYQKLCDDENSKTRLIDIAIGELRLLLLSGGVPENKETSFTSLLISPDFAWRSGRGWHAAYDLQVGTLSMHGGIFPNPCAESYQAEYDLSQSLTGVPKGLFRIDMQAFSRTRGSDLAWIERDSSNVIPVIYANEMELPVHNLMHTTFPNNENYTFLNCDSYYYNEPSCLMMNGTFVLNNQAAASLAFNEGYFDQSVYCFVEEGIIKAGIRETNKRTGAWTAFDNLRITYLPETRENYLDAVNCHLKKAKEIERLAKLKKVDCQQLSRVITETDLSLPTADVDGLRDKLRLLNKSIISTRKELIFQEFGDINSSAVYFSESQLQEDYAKEDEMERMKKYNEKRDSIKIAEDYADSYYYIANLLVKQDMNHASKLFQKSFDYYMYTISSYKAIGSSIYSSKWEDCYDYIVKAYDEKGQYDNSISLSKRFIDVMNQSSFLSKSNTMAKIYGSLGDIYLFKKKDYSSAEEAFRRQAEVNQYQYEFDIKHNIESSRKVSQAQLASSFNSLAYALTYQGKYDEALNTIDRAIELQPEEPNYYDSKGEIMFRKGDIEGARAMWDKVVAIDSEYNDKYDSSLYKLLFNK